MPPATAELILEIVRSLQSDSDETRRQIGDLYTLIKGNGRPGLRQTQDELVAMRSACQEHRNMVAATQAAMEARRDGWLMFFLRPLWPLMIGLLIAGMLHAARTGGMPPM